jgi:uncharacterized OB-fold protein
MKKCPNCMRKDIDSQRFCKACGTEIFFVERFAKEKGVEVKMANKKQLRREMAIQRKRKKQTITTGIIAVVMIAIIALLIFNIVSTDEDQVYTDGYATITLHENGKFTAVLYHNEQYSGTYEISENNEVTFIYDGTTTTTELEQDKINIPHEWSDGHGHGLGSLPIRR